MLQSLLDKLFEKLLLPIIDEKVRGYRYGRNVEQASALLQSDEAENNCKGLAIVKELVRTGPSDLQEIYDILCRFVARVAGKDRPVASGKNDVLLPALRLLCSLPKYDRNGWPYNIEIPELHLKQMTLHCFNFENTVLYDSVFEQVDFSRSSFKGCDLGGCCFVGNSSVEWCNFQGARLNMSPLSKVPSQFRETWLWGTNLEKADIARCLIQNVDNTPLDEVLRVHGENVELL